MRKQKSLVAARKHRAKRRKRIKRAELARKKQYKAAQVLNND